MNFKNMCYNLVVNVMKYGGKKNEHRNVKKIR